MNKAVEVAKSFIGMKEIPGNMGFEDERFEELMEEVGWQKGQAWCSYWVELVWKLAFPDQKERLDKLFAAGAVKTYNNFKGSEYKVDHHPEPGCVAIWQTWKDNLPHWTGHAGIVVRVINDNQFESIEGNTNSSGGRDGIEVAKKIRKINLDTRNGLVLKGFIHQL
jgi:hypothetical protein